jgi:hypothetical protein
MSYTINDDDFKVLERHGLTLRFEEKNSSSSSSPAGKININDIEEKQEQIGGSKTNEKTLLASYSMDPDEAFGLDQGMMTTELQTSDATDLSDVAFSLSAIHSNRSRGQKSAEKMNKSLSRMSNSSSRSTATSAITSDNNMEDLNRQLAAAHQRLNMLEKMLKADDHYHETLDLLHGYQKQLAQLHEEATGCGAGGSNAVGYHTPISVARAKERLASRKMSAAYTRRTAELVKKLKAYEQTIHKQQEMLANPPPPQQQQQQQPLLSPVSTSAAAPRASPVASGGTVVEPLSSSSPSARAAKMLKVYSTKQLEPWIPPSPPKVTNIPPGEGEKYEQALVQPSYQPLPPPTA